KRVPQKIAKEEFRHFLTKNRFPDKLMHDNHFQPNTQFSLFPPAIKNLLIINGLVYVAQFTPITSWILDNYFSLWPIASGNFYPWQLVSYMFMHGNLSHIFFNLFALWMFGLPLEQRWGSSRF